MSKLNDYINFRVACEPFSSQAKAAVKKKNLKRTSIMRIETLNTLNKNRSVQEENKIKARILCCILINTGDYGNFLLEHSYLLLVSITDSIFFSQWIRKAYISFTWSQVPTQ
jgi:hypothetical protein